MDRNFQRALALARVDEGGWADNPKDPGGATMKGVTLDTFRAFVKPNATKQDLRKITDEQVATVFYRQYWAVANCQALPSGVDYAVFDFAINSGPSRAVKYLQATVGAVQDGRCGPATVAAVNTYGAERCINDLCDARLAYMKRIRHRTTKALLWDTFGRGWSKRVASVRAESLAMVGDTDEVQKVPVPVPRPEVPKEIDEKVKKERSLLGWLTTLVSGGGLGAAGVFANWQTVAVLAVFFIVIIVLVLVFGKRILGFVDEARARAEASA